MAGKLAAAAAPQPAPVMTRHRPSRPPRDYPGRCGRHLPLQGQLSESLFARSLHRHRPSRCRPPLPIGHSSSAQNPTARPRRNPFSAKRSGASAASASTSSPMAVSPACASSAPSCPTGSRVARNQEIDSAAVENGMSVTACRRQCFSATATVSSFPGPAPEHGQRVGKRAARRSRYDWVIIKLGADSCNGSRSTPRISRATRPKAARSKV